jgi:hypothetical protein
MPTESPDDEAARAARMPGKDGVSRLGEKNRTSPSMGEPNRAQCGVKSPHTLLQPCQQSPRLATTNVNGIPVTSVVERNETTSKYDSIVGKDAPPKIRQIDCVEGLFLAKAYGFELGRPQWLGSQGKSELGVNAPCQPTEVNSIAVGREKNLARAQLELSARSGERRSPRPNAVRPCSQHQFGRLFGADRENRR